MVIITTKKTLILKTFYSCCIGLISSCPKWLILQSDWLMGFFRVHTAMCASVSFCFADIIHEQDRSFPREDSPLRASSAALPSPVQRWETDLWLHMNPVYFLCRLLKESVLFTSAACKVWFICSCPLLKHRVGEHFFYRS